jgi:hypothetical protein
MALVTYKERDKWSFEDLSEPMWNKIENFIRIEGIYVFGGIVGENTVKQVCNDNSVYVLSLAKVY